MGIHSVEKKQLSAKGMLAKIARYLNAFPSQLEAQEV